MGAERRRTGFRLSWTASDKDTGDEAQPDEAVTEVAPSAVETMTAEATTNAAPDAGAAPEAGPPTADRAEAASDAPAPPTGQSSGEDATGATDGESSEFLVSLVGAMRGVAESSRDASLAELRTTVDTHIEQLNTASAEREGDLRRAADLDLQGVGDWERDETERIRAEAESRREARRTKLDQHLAEHRAASERQVEAARARLADYERDLAAFFAQLGEISDPAAFVAAAKRMPKAPDLSVSSAATAPRTETEQAPASGDESRPATMGTTDETPTDAAAGALAEATATDVASPESSEAEAPEATTDNRLAERLAQLDQRIAGGTQPVAATAPTTANGGETSTAVIVKGLGSFGAITSFKQALERVEGVRGVTLSLGPTGEFVYRASHAPDYDMIAAVQSVEGPSATVEDTDGTLVVTLSRQR